jgi:hypothetical protein
MLKQDWSDACLPDHDPRLRRDALPESLSGALPFCRLSTPGVKTLNHALRIFPMRKFAQNDATTRRIIGHVADTGVQYPLR